jgi:hypothetical protein
MFRASQPDDGREPDEDDADRPRQVAMDLKVVWSDYTQGQVVLVKTLEMGWKESRQQSFEQDQRQQPSLM